MGGFVNMYVCQQQNVDQAPRGLRSQRPTLEAFWKEVGLLELQGCPFSWQSQEEPFTKRAQESRCFLVLTVWMAAP